MRAISTNPVNKVGINDGVLEKVMLCKDLAPLSEVERLQHIKNVCDSIGLNAVTTPIQLIRFDGKLIMYFTKDATEQLRSIRKVSVTSIDKEIINGVYIVTAHVAMPDGRQDISTGVLDISAFKGDKLANAMMKAETKAKRRATLSICGLGFAPDESEIESMQGARKVDIQDIPPIKEVKKVELIEEEKEQLKSEYQSYLHGIRSAQTQELLKGIWEEIKSTLVMENPSEKDIFLFNSLKEEVKSRLTFLKEEEDQKKFVSQMDAAPAIGEVLP